MFFLSGLLPNIFLISANSCTSSICDEPRAVNVCVRARMNVCACVHLCIFVRLPCHLYTKPRDSPVLPFLWLVRLLWSHEAHGQKIRLDKDSEKQGEPMDQPEQMKTLHNIVGNKFNKYINVTFLNDLQKHICIHIKCNHGSI